jgi:glycosyltransferase involved in cell wall biosynthesis
VSINPLVSAIIPTYNRANTIREAVDSVLGQTYPDIEVVVVDDGSTDDTQARLKPYGDRIRVVTQSNAGPAAARNRGMAASRGELIAFLDSDDIWLPAKIARQVNLMQRVGSSVPCCLCNIVMQWDAGERASFDISLLKPAVDEGVWINADEILATRFVLFNQGIVIRRDVVERVGGFDESLRLLEDHELALRLSLEGPWAFIREPLVVWHETVGSLYHKAQNDEVLSKLVQILERHLAKVEREDKHRGVRKHVIRELKRTRRQLWAAKMAKMGNWGASAIGNALRKTEHFRESIFRRSPWFPTMKVAPVDR